MSELAAPIVSSDLKQLAADVLAKAMKAGATDAEAVVYEGDEFSALVRLGQVETLKESGSRAVGLRVFIGQRTASTSSSDFSAESIERLVEGAVTLAKITSEDPFAGLPDADAFGSIPGDLKLYFDDVHEQPPAERIEIARRCEAAAMAYDTRIQNSGGGDFDAATSHKILMNSRGFVGEYRRSYCGFSASPIAVDAQGGMQRNYWFSNSRTTRRLENPEEIGKIAAQRALKRLGARQVKTQKAPVVFSAEIARGIIGNIFSAAEGDAIYRNASFFSGKLGEVVAGENITVVDDGTMVFDESGMRIGGFGTSPFDGEGLPTRRTVIVERGVLKNYVMNTYTARKLRELRMRKIPALLISPLFRPDQPFFKWYGNIHRLMLDSFYAFFVQNEESKKLLDSLDIKQPVFVSGDTRFDRVIDIVEAFEPIPVIADFCGNHQVIVAGSTWEEDEEELDHFANTHPDIRFIIAPHEIEKDHLKDIESLFRNTIRYSELETLNAQRSMPNAEHLKPTVERSALSIERSAFSVQPNVLIIDNIGMLARLYFYADVCYVGGGFGDDGVHNVLEAAVYGKPVITGPVIEKYMEVMELADTGGVVIIDNALEAESVFSRLLNNKEEYSFHGNAARNYVYARRGATEKIVRYIQENRLLTS